MSTPVLVLLPLMMIAIAFGLMANNRLQQLLRRAGIGDAQSELFSPERARKLEALHKTREWQAAFQSILISMGAAGVLALLVGWFSLADIAHSATP